MSPRPPYCDGDLCDGDDHDPTCPCSDDAGVDCLRCTRCGDTDGPFTPDGLCEGCTPAVTR